MLPQFDRSRLVLRPLNERIHDLSYASLLYPVELPPVLPPKEMADLAELGKRMAQAKERKTSILMLMGAHVLRAGVQRQLIDLMEKGLVTHVGMNGAGPIHDYELSRIGATCESVARYIRSGEFGLWKETGEINDIVREGAAAGLGLGEAIGKAIQQSNFPYKETSVLAAGYRLGVPVTVHVGIGYDIIHEHPNFDPAAFGTASYRDFLAVCDTVSRLEGGVFLCFGSAVMGPEVYLKALSMARNVAHQEGRKIANFTTAAFDLIRIEGEWQAEAPKSNPQYYYRPWKTILVRTVADGGESFYICGDHRQTVPHLRQAALNAVAERVSAVKAPTPVPEAPKLSASSAPQPNVQKPAVTNASAPQPKQEKPAPVTQSPSQPKIDKPAAAKPSPPQPKLDKPAVVKAPPPQSKPVPSQSKPDKPPAAKAPLPQPKTHKPMAAEATPPKVQKTSTAAAKSSAAAPASQLTNETIFMRELAELPARRKEAAKRKADAVQARKVEQSPRTAKNLEGAVAQYLELKEWVRANDATELEWYEAGSKEGWQHAIITKDDFLRLFYRIVWTSGSQHRVVVSKEDDYFHILSEVLYTKGRFQPRRQSEFLMKVAAVLGGSADNRKNKAVVQVVELLENTGWEEFRVKYASPQAGLSERLQTLPLIGPKEARQLLHQLGIADSEQDNQYASRLAGKFGYADAARCIQDIAARTEDRPTTVDFVIWDAGSNGIPSAKP